MSSKKTIITLLFSVTAFCCINGVSAQTYLVKKISPGSLIITGNGKAIAWADAAVLDHFIYPWENTPAPATSFSALWDGQWLFCRFLVQDDSVITYINRNEKREPAASDRVEIFFKADDAMAPYYCLEMDATGRVLDYAATLYRKMNYQWQWPKDQLLVKTARTKDGYVLEAAISMASLAQLGLLKENKLQAGLFRAECIAIENGKPDLKWISWIDPKSAKPDFHIAAAFGVLKLE